MLDNFNSKQKKIIIAVAILIAIGVVYYIYNSVEKKQMNFEENILVEKNNKTSEERKEEDEELIVIHITGSVITPGIVRLKQGSRIEDAIQAAGGLTEDADISKINLAYILEDGTKLRIPSNLDIDGIENENFLTKDSGENMLEVNEENKTSSTININKATQADFETLPGIGPSLASKIISYRDKNGKFEKLEDIKNVNGIGDSKYENIKDYIYVK